MAPVRKVPNVYANCRQPKMSTNTLVPSVHWIRLPTIVTDIMILQGLTEGLESQPSQLMHSY